MWDMGYEGRKSGIFGLKTSGIWDIWPENFWDMGYLSRKHLGYGISESLCHPPVYKVVPSPTSASQIPA